MIKVKKSLVGIVSGLGLALGLLWLMGTQAHSYAAPAAELHVCPSGCAYSSIQAAVDAANNGDLIKVAQGNYADLHVRGGITQVVYLSKTIALQGGYTTSDWNTADPDANLTVLDAQGQGRVMAIVGPGISPTVAGFCLTGGNAHGLGGAEWGYNAGGGVFVLSATASISGNLIYNNTGGSGDSFGGGVYLRDSQSTLTYNSITSNTALHGDGVCLQYSPASLTGNTISANGSDLSGWGGGVELRYSDASLTRNTISGNQGGSGGGVSVDRGQPFLSHNVITGNIGFEGGGLYLYVSGASLSDNLVQGNVATQNGGGLWLYWGSPSLVNTVVADNSLTQQAYSGAGIYSRASWPRLRHTTLARNSGGDGSAVHATGYDWAGDYYPSHIWMTNTIIFSHTMGITVTAGDTVTLDATLWQANGSNWGGAGTISHDRDCSGDPAFTADGYHLAAASAALDQGVEAGVVHDIDGETRPSGAGYDLGADELPAAPPGMVWDKQLSINGGAFQGWNDGPFTIAPGYLVTIVDRVWVSSTQNVSFTLGETWDALSEWVGYQASAGTVTQAGRGATWSALDSASNTWHILTQTLRVSDSSDQVGALTETLAVQGAPYQLPARVIEFHRSRPQPAWNKIVSLNGGAPQNWDTAPFAVSPGDEVTIVDQVWVTHTASVTFTLTQSWQPGLNLIGSAADAGTVTPGANALSWLGVGELANQWHSLTVTLHVSSAGWLAARAALTETLFVEGAPSQLEQRVFGLVNLDFASGCHARVNDGATIYPDVQAAIDAAQMGDLVKVAGRCTAINHYGGLAQVVYLNKSLTVRGGYTTTHWASSNTAAFPTTLDAQGQGRAVYISPNVSPRLEGLHITGGNATGLGGRQEYDAGGGVYIDKASAIISGNLIYSNTAQDAGGVYLNLCEAQLKANIIASNTASGTGGGLYLFYSPAALDSNTVSDNAAATAGGLYLETSHADLRSNIVRGNTSANGAGGIHLFYSYAHLSGNVVQDNTTQNGQGGGLQLYRSDASLNGDIISGNSARYGGGLYIFDQTPDLVNIAIVDNLAWGQGSGLYLWNASPRLLYATIAGNGSSALATGDGVGIYVTGFWRDGDYYPSSLVMSNTIVANHSVGISVTGGDSAAIGGILWDGSTPITVSRASTAHVTIRRQYTGAPVFAADGYHLGSTSAAIGRAVDIGVSTDIDGQSRPQSGGYDLGADEFTCVSVTGVSINGPDNGLVGASYAFVAEVSPPSASPPFVYTWAPLPLPGSLVLPGQSVVTCTWDAPGDYVITVTAANCGGSQTDTHTITISVARHIYLPLVLRNS